VLIPPGGAAIPHFHRGFKTAIYIIKGRVPSSAAAPPEQADGQERLTSTRE
jgi:hypothetical protein